MSAVGKKRKKMTTRQDRRSQPKRARQSAHWRTIAVEYVTPETTSGACNNAQGYEPGYPGQYEDDSVRLANIQGSSLIEGIARMLQRLCCEQEVVLRKVSPRVPGKPPYRSAKYPDGSSSVFFSLSKPPIGLRKYVARFVQFMQVSRSVYIVSLIYLDRVRLDDELLTITEMNIHRLVTSAICTAAKFMEDEEHRNSMLGEIGGVPTTDEMNVLEAQFLRRLGWNCSVAVETYRTYEEKFFNLLKHGDVRNGVCIRECITRE